MHTLRTFAALALLCACAQPQPNVCCTERPADTQGGEVPERFGAVSWSAGDLNSTYVVDASSAGDITGPTITLGKYKMVWFELVMANTSAPDGVVEIEGSLDGTNWFDIYIDQNKVYGANFEAVGGGAFAGGTQIAISSPAGTVILGLGIENPPLYLRLFYDSNSGGAAGTTDVAVFLRSN